MNTKRRNTKLEAEGAEFLVLGQLLMHGIPSYKAYTNMPDYDLVCINPEKKISCNIQVKSRFNTDWDGFIVKDPDSKDFQFLVLVTLNRGITANKKRIGEDKRSPEFFVFPKKYISEITDSKNNWGKITKSRMKDYVKYKDGWGLISKKMRL